MAVYIRICASLETKKQKNQDGKAKATKAAKKQAAEEKKEQEAADESDKIAALAAELEKVKAENVQLKVCDDAGGALPLAH
jgi:hypothetical protein